MSAAFFFNIKKVVGVTKLFNFHQVLRKKVKIVSISTAVITSLYMTEVVE